MRYDVVWKSSGSAVHSFERVFHVIGVWLIVVNASFCGEDVKGREFEVCEIVNGPAVGAVRVDVVVNAL